MNCGSPALELRVEGFSAVKAGYRDEQYEDAWTADPETRRIAIADGASDGFESRLWSRALVERFSEQPPDPDGPSILDWLSAPAQDWHASIAWDDLPWFGVEKARRGTYATFLGLTFHDADDDATTESDATPTIGWSAIAIGDACLFQVREDHLIESVPISQAADFDTSPPLLSTQPAYSQKTLQDLFVRSGALHPDDALILATDALAAWFLGRVEEGDRPWTRLLDLEDSTFRTFVDEVRAEETMRNDDVTLVVIRAVSP